MEGYLSNNKTKKKYFPAAATARERNAKWNIKNDEAAYASQSDHGHIDGKGSVCNKWLRGQTRINVRERATFFSLYSNQRLFKCLRNKVCFVQPYIITVRHSVHASLTQVLTLIQNSRVKASFVPAGR